MNPIVVQIGNIRIYWYSLIMLIAILTGGYLVLKEDCVGPAKKRAFEMFADESFKLKI